ncbi:hypothetical protein MWH28_10240 [Natroniella sulfidigena]|uniref:hypothetical protein n=1 Tax=Natroniella sulfidigena TaxID=723921 RepID=UPI002009DFB6|nr:hypothetical protein [Natroniella sulfidigena]MCK8817739.1 hypothetical protein [Natroniella sulfidigena]
MKRTWMLLLIMSLLVATAGTAFAGQIYGTKAHGMGGAFTAVADDASAIYWNPAGLVRSGRLGFEANFGAGGENFSDLSVLRDHLEEADEDEESLKELLELDDIGVNLNGLAAVNLRNFGLGVTLNNNFVFESTGSKEIDEDELEIKSDGSVEYNGDLPEIKASNTFIGQGIFSMGTNLTNAPLNLGTVSIGANAKYLTANQYDLNMEAKADGDTFEMIADDDPRSANGFGLDTGALVRATDMVNVGVNVRNLVTSWGSHEIDDLDERLPRTVTLGAAANLPFPIGATVAADIEIPDEGDEIYRLGAEKDIILGLLAVRLGGYQIDGDRTYTGGLGLDLPFIDLDLAGDSDSNYSFAGTVNF